MVSSQWVIERHWFMQSFSTVHSLVSSTHHLNQNTHAHVHSHNLIHTNITNTQYRLSHLTEPFTSYPLPLSRTHTSAHASLPYFSCCPSMRALMQTVHHQIIDMNHSIVSCTLNLSTSYTNPCLIKELLHSNWTLPTPNVNLWIFRILL